MLWGRARRNVTHHRYKERRYNLAASSAIEAAKRLKEEVALNCSSTDSQPDMLASRYRVDLEPGITDGCWKLAASAARS
jgi:hypothetical protein